MRLEEVRGLESEAQKFIDKEIPGGMFNKGTCTRAIQYRFLRTRRHPILGDTEPRHYFVYAVLMEIGNGTIQYFPLDRILKEIRALELSH